MSTTKKIVRRGRNRKLTQRARARTPKQKVFGVVRWCVLAGLVVTALGALTVALLFWSYGRDPRLRFKSIGDYSPKQVSRVYANDGTVVGEIFEERRTFVSYEQIPKVMIEAIVAAEDAKFWTHEGIDYLGMIRALFANLRAGRKKQGASTITQQVVKTLLLSPERTFKRKVQEIILARRIERELSKQEILVLYLNQIYFGHGRYGVQEATRFYFGKDIDQVSIGEAALLAGLPQAPEKISPLKNENRAKVRQTYVLRAMEKHGYLDAKAAEKWIKQPIQLAKDPFPALAVAPEWSELAMKELATFGEEFRQNGAMNITTSLQIPIQKHVAEALRLGLQAVDKRQKFGRTQRHVKRDTLALTTAKLAKKISKAGLQEGKRYDAVVVSMEDSPPALTLDLGKRTAQCPLPRGVDRYNPEGKRPSQRFKVGDIVQVELLSDATDSPQSASGPVVALAKGPEGAVVVLDVATRNVVALVGGYAVRPGDFNRATMANRQPGSAFKPFVYAAAIDSEQFTAASIVNDAPEVYDLWKPKNYKRGAFLGPVRLRYALAKSINTVAIRLLHDVGPERVGNLARDMGVGSQLPKTLSLALGAGEVTPLELTNAFATLAAGGLVAKPRFVQSVNGQPVPSAKPIEALRPEAAYVIVDMLRSVITEGTGHKAASLRMPIVGKTGTTNRARDAWFVGLTPKYAIGVWIGFDDGTPLGRGESGGKTALPVFIEIAKALEDVGKEFARPESIVTALIDKKTGLLAPDGADPVDSYLEVFMNGTAPEEFAPAPGQVDVESFVLDQYEEEDPITPPTDKPTAPAPPDKELVPSAP